MPHRCEECGKDPCTTPVECGAKEYQRGRAARLNVAHLIEWLLWCAGWSACRRCELRQCRCRPALANESVLKRAKWRCAALEASLAPKRVA